MYDKGILRCLGSKGCHLVPYARVASGILRVPLGLPLRYFVQAESTLFPTWSI